MFPSTLLSMALPALALAADVLPSETILQFPLGSWFENLAVRSSGELLLTLHSPTASIVSVKHPATHHLSSEVIATLHPLQRLLGIAEVPTDDEVETYVVVGDKTDVGTCSAYTVKFPRHEHGKPVVHKVIDMDSTVQVVNGVTHIPGVRDAALIADSGAGTVGYLNLTTGTYDATAFAYPEMLAPEGALLPLGVNGLKIRDGHLYFSNTFEACIYRIPITPAGYPSASPELVANLTTIGVSATDDFTFDRRGNIFTASNTDNKVVFSDLRSGKSEVVVGGNSRMTVAGDTAVAFGRTLLDAETLYVSTSGGLGLPVSPGNRTEGAKVVAVDTACFY